MSKFENSEDNVEDDVLEDLEMVVEMVGEEEEWAIAASNEAAEEDNLPQVQLFLFIYLYNKNGATLGSFWTITF